MSQKPNRSAGNAGIAVVRAPGIFRSFPSLTSAPEGGREASIVRRLNLRRLERPWKSALGLFLDRLLVRTDEAGGEDRADHGDDQRGDPDRPGVMLEGAAEQVAARAEDCRPDDSARRIEEKELLPIVAID